MARLTTHTPLPARRLARFAVVAALVAVPLACGDDDDAVSTGASSDTTLAATDTTVAAGTGGAGDFCTKYKEVDELSVLNNLDQDATPDQIQAALDQAATDVNELVQVSPAEVRADVETIEDAFGRLKSAIEDANYDMTTLSTDAQLQADLSNGDVDGAGQRLSDYYTANCS